MQEQLHISMCYWTWWFRTGKLDACVIDCIKGLEGREKENWASLRNEGDV